MKHLIVKQLPDTLTPNTTYYVDLGNRKYKQYVTDSEAKVADFSGAAGTQVMTVAGTDYNTFTVVGSVYLNDDNVVNLVLSQEQNATPYKMFVENIKIEIE